MSTPAFPPPPPPPAPVAVDEYEAAVIADLEHEFDVPAPVMAAPIAPAPVVAAPTFAAAAPAPIAAPAAPVAGYGQMEQAPVSLADYQPNTSALPFDLIENEQLIKTFELGRGRRFFTSYVSFLWVTDSRIIYANEYKQIISRGRSYDDIQINLVNGLRATVNMGWHRWWGLAGIILGIAGIPLILAFGLGLILIGLGVVCILKARQPVSTIGICAALSAPSILMGGAHSRDTVMSKGKAAGTEAARALVDPDRVDAITRELSALVLDIQARGALAAK